MRGHLACLLITASLATIGCDEPHYEYAAQRIAAEPKSAMAPVPDEAPAFRDQAAGMRGETAEAPATEAPDAKVSRKVIYNATLDLAVEDLDSASAKVGEMLASSGGYIAEETMTGSPGSTRTRFWRLRIPIDGFDGFVTSVMALGELVNFNRTSQDVTAEFYDVEARIKNKQVQEQTLQKMLEERSGQLEEVLKVETELSRVRGEIEQMQGRIRVLQNLSSLATLTLTLREHERFQPAAPVVADFPTQVARTWQESVGRLVDAGKALVLFVVGQAVWLPFWAIGLLIAWAVGRKAVALARSRPTPPADPSPGGRGA
ncbi:DUF4349 domain-containing protein [Paludisphaera sp.]|uniref:DUF4349 domain-containing protein n=1 Tax=Paludisphaera sp. TaxID=2017432 RepID=UPI00301D6FC9